MASYTAPPIPTAFIWRRAHSLTGLWLVLFLMEHLLANSQAALFFGNEGNGFVDTVNSIKNLPYLPAIEIFLLGVPLLIHALWGIQYLFTAKYTIFPSDGSAPALPEKGRNQAYTWQRITSWILLVGILAHVIQMRFLEYPSTVNLETQQLYVNRVQADAGLSPLAKKLNFQLYDQAQVKERQEKEKGDQWTQAWADWPLEKNQWVAVSPSFGVAELLLVRDTFKSPMMVLLYTGLVLAACFHGFNGLWTFMISWGITLTARSQQLMRAFATGLMVIVAFLGLMAIWGSYLST